MTLEQAMASCPKRMTHGPCGGVHLGGSCEVDEARQCPYPAIADALPWRRPNLPAGHPEKRTEGRLEASLRAGTFALIAEAYTPDSADLTPLIETYKPFRDKIVAVNIAEHALATPHASSLAAAACFEAAGIEAVVNITCRDRNRIGLQGELLGAAALGVKNVFCVTGDHPALGDHPEAVGVFDLDSLELIRLVSTLRDEGKLLSGRHLETKPRLLIGCAANPFSYPRELQAERVAAKVAAGAEFIQSQAIFDLARFEMFLKELSTLNALKNAWLIAGVAVVGSLAQARWLRDTVPGAQVPAELIEQLERTPPSEQREVGLRYTVGLVHTLRRLRGVSGALLFPLHGDVAALAEIIERL